MKDATSSGSPLTWLAGKRRHLTVGFMAIALVLLAACGGNGAKSGDTNSTATATSGPQAQSATEQPSATSQAGTPAPQPTLDAAWAREQVVPVLTGTYEAYVAHDWVALYKLYSDEDKKGCSQDAFVSKIDGIWQANQSTMDEGFQKKLQDLENGAFKLIFAKITPDRITFTMAEGTTATVGAVVLENDKWLTATIPLGQNCAQFLIPISGVVLK